MSESSRVADLLLRWVKLVQKLPILIVVAFIAATAGFAWYTATNLKLKTDYADLISADLPFHGRWVEYKKAFPNVTDTIVVVLEGGTAEQRKEFANQILEQTKTNKEKFEYSYFLTDKSFFEKNALLYLSDDDLGKVLKGEAVKDSSTQDFLEIRPHLDYSDLLPGEAAILKLYEIEREIESQNASSGVQVSITGVAPLSYEEMQNIATAMNWAGAIAFLISAMILLWGLGSVRITIFTLVGLVVGLIATAAFTTLAIGHLNLISVAFAVLFIGLGIDYSLHLMLRYRELLIGTRDADHSLQQSISQVGQSLWLCALTTCAGFYAFIPTDYVGVSELGIIAGTGMFINFFVQVTLTPALVHLFPHEPAKLKPFKTFRPAHLLYEWLLSNSRKVVAASALIGVISALIALTLTFDPNPLSLQDPTTQAYQTFRRLLDDPKASPWSIKILERDFSQAQALANEIQELPSVSEVRWIGSFLPANQDLRIQSLPPALRENLRPLEVADLPQDLRERFINSEGIYRLEVYSKENLSSIDEMREFADEVSRIAPQATDDPVTIPGTADAVVAAFLMAGVLALILAFAVIYLALRSLRDTVFALTPLVLGGLITLAVLKILGGSFNFANIVVLPLLIGIAMDSGIHVIFKYRKSTAGNPIAGSTSRAMFFSALTNVMSFGTLAFANHKGMASMGLLLSLGLAITLSCIFIVLPALLKFFDRAPELVTVADHAQARRAS